jgi:hypothetical protein
MANYIKEVGKLLGVGVEEVFQVDGDPSIKDCFFKFSDNDLQLSAVNGGNDTWTVASDTRLLDILYGRLRIRKLPRKPAIGDMYCYPDPVTPLLWGTCSWRDDVFDNYRFQHGLIFATREEAIEIAKQMQAVTKQEGKNND